MDRLMVRKLALELTEEKKTKILDIVMGRIDGHGLDGRTRTWLHHSRVENCRFTTSHDQKTRLHGYLYLLPKKTKLVNADDEEMSMQSTCH